MWGRVRRSALLISRTQDLSSEPPGRDGSISRFGSTIFSFCEIFYDYLPRATLFLQDDPQIATIVRDIQLPHWPAMLEASFDARLAATAQPPTQLRGTWQPAGCMCAPVTETFDNAHYYRQPLSWWMRSFLAPFANETSSALPHTLVWPATAQFALPRAAIRGRSRAFYERHARLTEVAAPLVSRMPQQDLRAKSVCCGTVWFFSCCVLSFIYSQHGSLVIGNFHGNDFKNQI